MGPLTADVTRNGAYCEGGEVYCKFKSWDCVLGRFGANAAAPGTAERVDGANNEVVYEFDWFTG